MGTAQRPGGNHVSLKIFTLALLMTLQFGPIQTFKLEHKTNLLSLRIMKQKENGVTDHKDKLLAR